MTSREDRRQLERTWFARQQYLRRRHPCQRRRREGIVMLAVMFVLMMGTVGAALAVDASTNALRAAGHNRTALQTRYMAEAQLNAAAGYIEVLGPSFIGVINASSVPIMSVFGAPEIDINGGATGDSRHHAARLMDDALCNIQLPAEVPPVQAGGDLLGNAAPTPAAGCAPVVSDLPGTTGPGMAWVPQRFMVDMYDCFEISQVMVAGEDQASPMKRMMCVLSARGRTSVPGAPTHDWTSGGTTYTQSTLQSLHEAQMTIITPEF